MAKMYKCTRQRFTNVSLIIPEEIMFNNTSGHVVQVPAARPESSLPSPDSAEARYPKRKRAEVHYNYEDSENTDNDSELEYMSVKVCIQSNLG